jgi:hypothetical protein
MPTMYAMSIPTGAARREPAPSGWAHIAEWQLDQPLEVVAANALALRERATSGGGRPVAGRTG